MKIFKLLKGLLLGYNFKSVDELAKYYFREPAKLGWWIERKIWPTKDYNPYTWPYTEQVLRDKISDCKGVALLAYECLIIWGYTPLLMCVYGRRYGKWFGHAVCIYTLNGHLNYFDNGLFVSLNHEDLNELAKKVAGERKYKDWYFTLENYDKLNRDKQGDMLNKEHGQN